MRIRAVLAVVLSLAIPAIARASQVGAVPEPETLALLGAGAVALVIARSRPRK